MVLSKSNSRRREANLHVLHDSQQSTCTFHAQSFGGKFLSIEVVTIVRMVQFNTLP